MRLDTILINNNYEIPAKWTAMEQRVLKESMVKHMSDKKDFEEFNYQMAICTDVQFGKMCSRLALRK